MKQIYKDSGGDKELYIAPNEIAGLLIRSDSYFYLAEITLKNGKTYQLKLTDKEETKRLKESILYCKG